MDENQIRQAISKARKGISQYLEIMDLFPRVNVAEDSEFQRRFNSYYRVRQRPPEWYGEYFSSMQRWKGTSPTFGDVLDHFNRSLGKYEPSFSSKLVATLDPNQPIWDKHVLENTNTTRPSYTSIHKVEQAKVAYQHIQAWYRQFLGSSDGKLVVDVFDREVPEHAKITSLKKVDFWLWQTRG